MEGLVVTKKLKIVHIITHSITLVFVFDNLITLGPRNYITRLVLRRGSSKYTLLNTLESGFMETSNVHFILSM